VPQAPSRERLDVLLVQQGLAKSRPQAQARILAGEVVVNDHRIDKPGTRVPKDATIRLKGDGLRWVSRGGLKLERALALWPIPVDGCFAFDVGASTGGFTDVLLTHGAARVYALDVGWGQLHEKLRQDPRVQNIERTHIEKLPKGSLDPAPTVAVCDVSFISLRKVLPAITPHLAPRADVVTLIKPQFEVGRERVSKGGIVRDPTHREEAALAVVQVAEALGLHLQERVESPITGADGNVEFLAWFSFCTP
jgi:23S rRNA (cytidine1920-2'-O)/16S rRNA (cytidine1409-2'-O)-methyltransferase